MGASCDVGYGSAQESFMRIDRFNIGNDLMKSIGGV